MEITNYNDKRKPGENEEEDDDGDQIIRLKIKRRRVKVNKPAEKLKDPEPKRFEKSDYIKL